MSKEPKKRTLKKLELNRETITDLTEAEAEGVEGGLFPTLPNLTITQAPTCPCSNKCQPTDFDAGCCTHALSDAVQLDCARAR